MRQIFFLVVLVSLSSCYMLRAYKARKMNLNDHKKFESVTIDKSENPYTFFDATSKPENFELKYHLDKILSDSYTAAFLIIKNDSIVYEKYFDGFDQHSLLPSNSMAKSFVGTLVGIAVDEGKIKSTSEPITNYIPEFLERDRRFKNITIQHLLDMRSGLDFNEGSYTLKDDAVKLGFRPNLVKHLLKAKIAKAPGDFKYQSINTQLLGLVLERATGKKISKYLEEKIWKPIGAEENATWNVDSKKRMHEMTSAGLNATARDFAKLGQLYLNNGEWQGQQVISKNWISSIADADSMERYRGYKNQWWNKVDYHYFKDSIKAVAFKEETANSGLVSKAEETFRVGHRTRSFFAHGFLKQVIYINPENNVVIVRFGRRWNHPSTSFVQFIYTLGERL